MELLLQTWQVSKEAEERREAELLIDLFSCRETFASLPNGQRGWAVSVVFCGLGVHENCLTWGCGYLPPTLQSLLFLGPENADPM